MTGQAIANAPTPSPFHPGERAIQARAGVREEAETRGRRMLSADINAQQAQFFRALSFVVAGHTEDGGQPWASLLLGDPGFIGIDEQRRQASITRGDGANPTNLQLRPGSELGLLGIDLATRRRNRLNGTVFADDAARWRIQVEQAYGNCPKYIRERPWPAATFAGSYQLREQEGLAPEAAALAGSAETFFIATASGPAADEAATVGSAWGADVSHRGGEAGFLGYDNGQLAFDDYPGNNMFNTLGNISRYPRCGLLILDFDSGDILQLAAMAQIQHGEDGRTTRLDIQRTRYWRAEDNGQ